MIFEKPDARRALRSMVQAALVVAVFCLAWSLSERLSEQAALREALRWLFSLLGLGTIGYVIENGIRSFKGSAFGATIDVQGGEDDTLHSGDDITVTKN
jgi:hypothetical protein